MRERQAKRKRIGGGRPVRRDVEAHPTSGPPTPGGWTGEGVTIEPGGWTGEGVTIEHQLSIPNGHATGAFAGKPIVHIFATHQEALDFFADYVVGPAVKLGLEWPAADIRIVVRHKHRPATPEGGAPR